MCSCAYLSEHIPKPNDGIAHPRVIAQLPAFPNVFGGFHGFIALKIIPERGRRGKRGRDEGRRREEERGGRRGNHGFLSLAAIKVVNGGVQSRTAWMCHIRICRIPGFPETQRWHPSQIHPHFSQKHGVPLCIVDFRLLPAATVADSGHENVHFEHDNAAMQHTWRGEVSMRRPKTICGEFSDIVACCAFASQFNGKAAGQHSNVQVLQPASSQTKAAPTRQNPTLVASNS